MSESVFLPRIETIFDTQRHSTSHVYYVQLVQDALRHILPGHMSFTEGNSWEALGNQRDQFHALLPLINVKWCDEAPGDISFFSISKFRANAFKFFYDMLSIWLLPGQRMNVVLLYAVDFKMPDIGDEVYTLCEVMIRVEKVSELVKIQSNFPIIETELRLGIPFSRYARRVLEIKGLTNDEKTATIQEFIAFLIERFPSEFDQDVITEMQHVLVTCQEDFKMARECRHLSRIISLQYIFRKALREAVLEAPKKRHLNLKLFRARIKTDDGEKTVLGILVGINFCGDKEAFEKSHILKAIKSYIPEINEIKNSFYSNRRGSEQVCTLYLEIEKNNDEEFTNDEIKLLRQELPNGLKDCIEHMMHPVFMPRNEEETMRNILSLSDQIKFLRDIPQVFISFDEQTHTHLQFTIILVRVLRDDDISIQEMFKSAETSLEYIHDRCQNAGILRKKYKKEATVFRVRMPKDNFIRSDHSIDLNKARLAVISELSSVVGEVRDYNGGMISKQNEVFVDLKDQINGKVKYNDLILENFFYSLTPVIMRNVLETSALSTLFVMLIESMEEIGYTSELYSIKIVHEEQFVFVMIKVEDRAVKEELSKAIAKLYLHSSQLATALVAVHDIAYIGYIYRSDEHDSQELFSVLIQNSLMTWEAKKLSQARILALNR